jgi:NAD(P)-dependent dehydrogenase (short-subunit alcohol dehydrogenase family)
MEGKAMRNKAAMITGGARGIGFAIAQRLYKDGYGIITVDMNEMENEAKEDWLHLICDITDSKSRQRVLDEIINKVGRLDVLVNNAGVAPKKRLDILDTTEESMDFVLGVNLKGTFFMTQLIANYMINQIDSGIEITPVIINISSISSVFSSTSRGEYCISKAGVSMITTLFADRLAAHGINVYEIRPGIIMTDMTSAVKQKYDVLIEQGLVPKKRWGQPEDVANMVAALCTKDFSFSTGDVIYCDGGLHISRL